MSKPERPTERVGHAVEQATQAMGQAVGDTGPRGERVSGQPLTPQNIHATLYHVLGIDPTMTFPNFSGRPMSLLDDPRPIQELI